MIFPFAMIGMVVGLLREKKIAAVASIYIFYGITLIIFFCNTRYRLPLMVLLIPLALYGVQILLNSIKSRNYSQAVMLMCMLILAFILEFLPIKGTDDLTAYYNTHALVLNAQGKRSEAKKFWQESSEMNRPYSAYANLSLASIQLKRRDVTKSIEYLGKITDSSFAASQKYEILGDISLHKGDVLGAESHFRNSLEINSGRKKVWRKLIRLLKNKNDNYPTEEIVEMKRISGFYR